MSAWMAAGNNRLIYGLLRKRRIEFCHLFYIWMNPIKKLAVVAAARLCKKQPHAIIFPILWRIKGGKYCIFCTFCSAAIFSDEKSPNIQLGCGLFVVVSNFPRVLVKPDTNFTAFFRFFGSTSRDLVNIWRRRIEEKFFSDCSVTTFLNFLSLLIHYWRKVKLIGNVVPGQRCFGWPQNYMVTAHIFAAHHFNWFCQNWIPGFMAFLKCTK